MNEIKYTIIKQKIGELDKLEVRKYDNGLYMVSKKYINPVLNLKSRGAKLFTYKTERGAMRKYDELLEYTY